MRKQIPENVKVRLNRIKTVIENVPNTVPNEMRTTFNFKGRKSPNIAEKVIEAVCDRDSVTQPNWTITLLMQLQY